MTGETAAHATSTNLQFCHQYFANQQDGSPKVLSWSECHRHTHIQGRGLGKRPRSSSVPELRARALTRTDWHGIETKSQVKPSHPRGKSRCKSHAKKRGPARGVRESTWWPALETVPEDMWGVASGGCRYRLNGAKPPAAKALCVKPAVAINSPATVTVALVLAGSLASDGRF